MAVAYVQNKGSQNASSSSLAEAFGSNVTAGNLLVGMMALGGSNVGTGVSTTPTDTLGHVYSATDIQLNAPGNAGVGRLWYVGNSSGGANTLTFHCVGLLEFTGEAAEFSGVSTTTVLDTHNSTTGTSSIALSPSITPTSSGALIIAGMLDVGASTVVPSWSNTGTGATFTAIPLSSVISNGLNQRAGLAYAIDVNKGTYIANAVANGGVSAAWAIFIAAFNVGGGAAANPTRQKTLTGAGH